MPLAVALAGDVIVQIALGISTLYAFGDYGGMQHQGIAYKNALNLPVIIAGLHQLNALVLFTLSLRTVHKLTREKLYSRVNYVI